MHDIFLKKIKKTLDELSLLQYAEFFYDLSKISSIKTGGQCICFIKINKKNDLSLLMEKLALEKPAYWLVVGDCTNILFNDGLLKLLIIKLGYDFDYINFNDDKISVGAACNLQKFIMYAARKGFDYSFLAGIPGTVGGAVMGNSGTDKKGINNLVSSLDCIYIKNNKAFFQKRQRKEFPGKYRDSAINNDVIITDIVFEKPRAENNGQDQIAVTLQQDGCFIEDRELIFKKIRDNIKNKKAMQPLNSRNIGCFFKNPQNSKLSAGIMIDRCNLKGFKFGAAQISEKHANFIENTEKSCSKDILTLSRIVRDFIRDIYNIDLEYEIKMVGFKK